MNIGLGLDKGFTICFRVRGHTVKFSLSEAEVILEFSWVGIGMAELTTQNLAEPKNEAVFFYGLFLRGHPLQKLRADIDVSPQVVERWQRLAARDRGYQAMTERLLAYRKHVLAIFDSLIFQEMTTPTRIQ
jgi:hypothetical protein